MCFQRDPLSPLQSRRIVLSIEVTLLVPYSPSYDLF